MMGMVQKIKDQNLLVSGPPDCYGRGIIIAGGGRYTKHAWAVAAHCRKLGWAEGIQVWHLGASEIPDEARPMFAQIDVELVDAYEVRKTHPSRILTGWELKVFAAMHCPWRHVMYLDADCHPDINPAEIFDDPEIKKTGSLFFSDISNHHKTGWGYVFSGLMPLAKEWETGQWIVDKKRAWMGLRWAFWYGEHADVWYQMGHGDKHHTEIAFRVSGVPYCLSEDARWEQYGIGQYWGGRRYFKHWMASKRMECPFPEEIQGQFDIWDSATAVL